MEEEAQKSFNFLLHWPQTIKSDPLTKEGVVDESNFVNFLNKFSKFLRWRQQRTKDVDEIAASQMLCCADKLLSVFNSPDVYVQLQAAKLLLGDEFRVLRQVMNLSIAELDTRKISGKCL